MNKRSEKWRIVVFVASILIIMFLWIKKDIGTIIDTIPKDQLFSVIATSALVSIFKFALIAGAVFLVKWLIGRNKNG